MEPQIKRRRIQKSEPTNPLPSTNEPVTGYFTGASVDIFCPKSIELFYQNGCFGTRQHYTAAAATPNSSGPLILFLEESFYLHSVIKCLRIVDLITSNELNTDSLWHQFCCIKKNFILHYVAYAFLRSKNWVVKSGLKFGGNFGK